MTNAWSKADRAERVQELNVAKHEALGTLLGMVDIVLIAQEHPSVFDLVRKLEEMRKAREAYRVAEAAYIDARFAR
jgi:hypothetical protein